MDLMLGYWVRSKGIYYRKIKRELEMGDESEDSRGIGVSLGGSSRDFNGRFKLPDALCSYQTTFLQDPDATLKHILTAMTGKQGYKE